MIISLILEALFFGLPLYIANGCASLSRSLPLIKDWKTPIDFGQSWHNKRILGDGKTFRGFVFGTVCGISMGLFQYFLAQRFNFEHTVVFNDILLGKCLLLALFSGTGGLIGDMVKSFFKRRVEVKRGRPWPPFDQLDFLIGGLLFGALIYFPPWKIVLILFIITPVVHFLTNVAAYLLKLKDVWW